MHLGSVVRRGLVLARRGTVLSVCRSNLISLVLIVQI